MSELAREPFVVSAEREPPSRGDESFFRTLAEMIPQMVWTKDAAGRNEYCSQKLLAYLNMSMHDFLHTPWDNVHPDDAALGRSAWLSAREACLPYEVELRMRPNHSTSYRWFLVRAVPYFDADGRLTKWFGTTTDIDAQKIFAKRQESIARGLTDMIAPGDLPTLPNFTIDGVYKPAEEDAKVGGDFYAAVSLPDRRLLFAIGDVTGHGLMAALAMDRVRNAIFGAALDTLDPVRVLMKVNRIMLLQRQPLVTAIVGFLDPVSGRYSYASAGHPPPILAAGGDVTILPYGGVPLGVTSEPHFGIFEGRVHPGSMLVLYTDGLIEFNRDVIRGEQLLAAAIRGIGAQILARPAHYIQKTVLNGGVAADDIAVMTIRGTARSA